MRGDRVVHLVGRGRGLEDIGPRGGAGIGSRWSLLCPDAVTCATVLPQLVYSSAPSNPWWISVPIAWDTSFSVLQPPGLATRWSATGVHNDTDFMSFAIYNGSSTPAVYTVRVSTAQERWPGKV